MRGTGSDRSVQSSQRGLPAIFRATTDHAALPGDRPCRPAHPTAATPHRHSSPCRFRWSLQLLCAVVGVAGTGFAAAADRIGLYGAAEPDTPLMSFEATGHAAFPVAPPDSPARAWSGKEGAGQVVSYRWLLGHGAARLSGGYDLPVQAGAGMAPGQRGGEPGSFAVGVRYAVDDERRVGLEALVPARGGRDDEEDDVRPAGAPEFGGVKPAKRWRNPLQVKMNLSSRTQMIFRPRGHGFKVMLRSDF